MKRFEMRRRPVCRWCLGLVMSFGLPFMLGFPGQSGAANAGSQDPTAQGRSAAAGSVPAAGLGLPVSGLQDPVERASGEHFFETKIRPLLWERCVDCHGPEQQGGGLRIDSRDHLLAGGDSGPALVPHRPDQSRLIQAVHRRDSLEMPPDEPLTSDQIAALEQWVRDGAVWTTAVVAEPTRIQRDSDVHWAFQPLVDPGFPTGAPTNLGPRSSVAEAVDAWIAQARVDRQLSPAPPADRRTLIRRASYVITGLPPSAAEVQAFEANADPEAYRRLVDSLLESPRYGEHWARHWLDLARYSDTKGYVYDREERFWTHAWSYRDWVIEAFNRDLPYNDFVSLQLAADQIAQDPRDLAAMGFLTVGRRFQGVKPDIIDDRIDVITRGLMGLTVTCARCHDHKYDAIPTADYYSLYGVLASCLEVEKSITPPDELPADYLAELRRRETEYVEQHRKLRAEAAGRARRRVGDYLRAQLELENYPDELFGQLFQPDDLLPVVVHRWADHLRRADRNRDRFFSAWHQLLAVNDADFPAVAPGLQAELQAAPADRVHPAVATALAAAHLNGRRDVVEMYVKLLEEYVERWESVPGPPSPAESGSEAGTEPVSASATASPPPHVIGETGDADVHELLFAADSPCVVPDEPIVEIEYFLDFASCETLWKLQRAVEQWVVQAAEPDRRVRTLEDRRTPVEPQIFRRGSPLRKGDYVPRQFLGLVAGPDRRPFQEGSGRRELAEAIVDPQNPLIARVIVNRIWGHVFGQPLVATPSDFGLRAQPPSHPELLDYLAVRFIESGWSIKDLIRQLVLSETFCQSSSLPADDTGAERGRAIDPDNRWYWRSPTRRLSIEQLRDSLLSAGQTLDLSSVGGRPKELWTEPFSRRRSIYGLVDRQFLPPLLRSFDFANPDLHIPWRSETTVAQQCLFFLNHPLVLQQAKLLSPDLSSHPDPTAAVQRLFQQVLQRDPTELEVLEAIEFLDQAEAGRSATDASAWEQLAQVLLSSNEFLFIE